MFRYKLLLVHFIWGPIMMVSKTSIAVYAGGFTVLGFFMGFTAFVSIIVGRLMSLNFLPHFLSFCFGPFVVWFVVHAFFVWITKRYYQELGREGVIGLFLGINLGYWSVVGLLLLALVNTPPS